MKVLIVEDDALLSVVESRIIERMDHQVFTAGTGAEAINKVAECNPDIILMDISLGGNMDGIETMQKIRKSSSVPVVYLSGSNKYEQEKRALSVEPIGFLMKPLDTDNLKSCFEKAYVNK